MKNGLRKILVSLIACIGVGTACRAADIIGEIIIPNGKDGCNPQLQIDNTGIQADTCTRFKWGTEFSANCHVLTWDTMEVCNGTDGNNACSPVASTETGTGDNDGCVRMVFQAKKGTNCDTNDGGPVYSEWVCPGYDPCKGLSTAEKQKTTQRSTRERTNPSGYNSNAGYFTSIGYYTVSATYCNNATKGGKEFDSCEVLSVGGGTRGSTNICSNGTYYECDWPTGETAITGVTSGKYNACVVNANVKPIPAPCADVVEIGEKDQATKCATMSVYKQTRNSTTNECVKNSTAYQSREFCDGEPGTPGVSPTPQCAKRVFMTSKDTSTGCSDVKAMPQVWSTASSKCVDQTGATAETLSTVCDGPQGPQGPAGTSACKTLITSETGTGNNVGCTRIKMQAKKGTDCDTNDGSATYSDWICKGADGTGVTIKGTVASCSALPTSGNTVGDIYLVSGQNYLGYMWTGSTWNCPNGGIPIQGPAGCAADVTMVVNTSDSNCYDVTITPKAPDGNGGCTTTGTPVTQTLCNGYDPCKGLSTAEKQKTTQRSTRERTNPSGYNSNAGYFTSIGYYTVSATYCNNATKGGKEFDSCEVLSVGGGTRGSTNICSNGTYYECDWPTGETAITGVTSGKYNACVVNANVKPIPAPCADIVEMSEKNTTTGCVTVAVYEQTRNSSGTCVKNSAASSEKEVCDGTPGASACKTVITSETGTGNNAGCTRIKMQAKKGSDCDTDDGSATYSGWICDGEPGVSPTPQCAKRVFMTSKNTSTGCSDVKAMPQVWSTTSSKCVDQTGATAETLSTVCDGPQGPQGPAGDVCDDVASGDLVKVVKSQTKVYTLPAGGLNPATYGSAYATAPGGYTVTSTMCNDTTKTVFASDKCAPVSVDSTALAQLPKCTGTIESCTRSDTNATYYLCDEVCQQIGSTYTNPAAINGSDSNCLNNMCYSTSGKISTSEKDGCGTGTVSKSVTKEDNCVDPKILTNAGVTYTYYTCTIGDSTKYNGIGNGTGKYTLRKPLENGGVSKIISDNTSALASKMDTSAFTKTAITSKLGATTYGSYSDVSALKTTVGDNSSGLVKDVADASAAAATASNKADAAQNTADSKIGQSDLNTALYGTGTSSNPASGSIAYKANNAATTASVNTALYGSGGTSTNPATGSIAAKANLGGSALQPSALYGTGSSSSPAASSIAYKANNALPAADFDQKANDWASTTDVSDSRPEAGSVLALVNTAQSTANAALPASSFNTTANSWLANTAQITVESASSSKVLTQNLREFIVGLADVVKSSGVCSNCPSGSTCESFCQDIPVNPLPAQQ